MQQMVKYGKYAGYAMESCPVKVVMSGGAGKSTLGVPVVYRTKLMAAVLL